MLTGWAATLVLIILNALGALDSHHGAWNVLRIVSTVTWVSAGALVLLAVHRRLR